MVLKRPFGEEGSDNSSIPHHPLSPPNKFRKVVNYVLKELSLQEIATEISAILEPAIRRMVKEEMESIIFCLQSSPGHSLFHQPEPSISRVLQLHFAKKMPSTIYTNSSIQDEDHAPLQIMLLDGKSKNVIQHGPFSLIKVEVLVLNADFAVDRQEDWSENEFSRNIVRERDGKRPLLVGEHSFSLVNGVGYICNIFFTDNSSWVRSRKFRLGVRAVRSSATGGTEIREAVSEAFVVLDHRGESYQKRNTPFLDDPVWRLKKISKMGASHKKLESHGIMTVKDFLMRYNIDPLFIRQVLGNGVPNRAWETIVRHANECHLDNTHYSYYNAAERVELLFNCVYKVIAVKFEGQGFQPLDALDSHQKTLVSKLKQLAFNQNELVPIHSLSATPSLSSTIQQNIASFGANLELQEDGPSIIDQAEPEPQLNFNLSDSASYPCTVEDGYLHDDDSTAQSSQPIQGFSPAAFLMDDSAVEPSVGGYSWYQTNPIPIFAPNTHTQFGEPSHPQTSPSYPFTTWELDNDLLTSLTPASHIGILSTHPEFGVDISGTGKPKAGWCKIRAAVMWKIVRRNAAARRKARFSSHYY